jgi:hypothetical protein
MKQRAIANKLLVMRDITKTLSIDLFIWASMWIE